MMVFRVEREAKVEDDEGEEDLELYHGQVHAQTSPNSSTKWDVKLALDTPLANLYGLKSPAFGSQMSALRCRVAVGIQTLIPFRRWTLANVMSVKISLEVKGAGGCKCMVSYITIVNCIHA